MKRIARFLRNLPGWNGGWTGKLAWLYLFLLVLFALSGPFIANDRPYRCILDGKTYYPILSGISEAELSVLHPGHSPVDWQRTGFSSVWRAPIPYGYRTIDLDAGTFREPGKNSGPSGRSPHWLGTDSLGRDVLSGMIRGCRVSLWIGFGSMLLALVIAVPLGAVAGYAGNDRWRPAVGEWIAILLLLVLIGGIAFLPITLAARLAWIACLLALGYFLVPMTRHWIRVHWQLPTDHLILGVISVIDGFPGLFVLLVILAILPFKGWLAVMLVIAVLRWPAMARYTRAEVLKLKAEPYIMSARLLNLPDRRILWRHIIPYAMRPVLVSFIFGVASAILAESSLSYLGIGLAADELNWGRLLAQARNHFGAWWLVVFPGLAISLTLVALYSIASAWERALQADEANVPS